jgi:F0F1-type ATP synthase membrane subunit a
MILMGDSMVIINLFPIALLFILTFLEVGVALIQAYIFTILTCIYLKDIFVGH